MKILITGGCGYIGSHTVVELLQDNYEVVIIDNLSNSLKEVLTSIETITKKKPIFYEGDVADFSLLRKIFGEHSFDAVIHFAGYKAVGESVQKPLMYYENNLESTLHLCKVMSEFGCKRLVFSSSATVYGNPKKLPLTEDTPLSTTNPYGTTKLMIENILRDVSASDSEWSIALLRYFNPIGAHDSGLIGENPKGIPNNLMPYIIKVAIGELPQLNIFGNDYDTKDGTGVRDYIHVVDLARGHISALKKIMHSKGIDAYNLGTGKGYSVLELVQTFEKVNHISIPYKIGPRRAGDIAECYADCSYAKKQLGWEAEKNLETMCRDSYHYISRLEK